MLSNLIKQWCRSRFNLLRFVFFMQKLSKVISAMGNTSQRLVNFFSCIKSLDDIATNQKEKK